MNKYKSCRLVRPTPQKAKTTAKARRRHYVSRITKFYNASRDLFGGMSELLSPTSWYLRTAVLFPKSITKLGNDIRIWVLGGKPVVQVVPMIRFSHLNDNRILEYVRTFNHDTNDKSSLNPSMFSLVITLVIWYKWQQSVSSLKAWLQRTQGYKVLRHSFKMTNSSAYYREGFRWHNNTDYSYKSRRPTLVEVLCGATSLGSKMLSSRSKYETRYAEDREKSMKRSREVEIWDRRHTCTSAYIIQRRRENTVYQTSGIYRKKYADNAPSWSHNSVPTTKSCSLQSRLEPG